MKIVILLLLFGLTLTFEARMKQFSRQQDDDYPWRGEVEEHQKTGDFYETNHYGDESEHSHGDAENKHGLGKYDETAYRRPYGYDKQENFHEPENDYETEQFRSENQLIEQTDSYILSHTGFDADVRKYCTLYTVGNKNYPMDRQFNEKMWLVNAPPGMNIRLKAVGDIFDIGEDMCWKQTPYLHNMRVLECGEESNVLLFHTNKLKMSFQPKKARGCGFKILVQFERPVDKLEPSPEVPNDKCGISGDLRRRGRIYGGDDAQVGDFPWQANIYLDKEWLTCGASILSSTWILTAAHCTKDQWHSIRGVIVGNANNIKNEITEQRLKVVDIIEHEYYKRKGLYYDIALMRVDPPIEFDGHSKRPICLPDYGVESNDLDGEICLTSGYGLRDDYTRQKGPLQYAAMKILGKDNCPRDDFICAIDESHIKTTCRGDSGGPLVCRRTDGAYYQVGVFSWARRKPGGGNHTCDPKMAQGYANVPFLKEWICEKTGNAVDNCT